MDQAPPPHHRSQANMFKLVLQSEDGEARTVMVKRVVPKELPAKTGPHIWEEFIASVRTEMQFYAELREEQNADIRHLFPTVHHSCGTPVESDSRPMDTEFSIIMQDLSLDYFQKPMMTEKEARVVLESLADMHSHFWGKMEGVQRGGFWVLARRHGEELGADEAWRGLLQRFPKLLDVHPDVEKIGSILGQRAAELDSYVGERGVTRIHGDAKGWNFFFGSEKAVSNFLFIDMQWTGRGHPLQVLMFMKMKIMTIFET